MIVDSVYLQKENEEVAAYILRRQSGLRIVFRPRITIFYPYQKDPWP